MAIKDCKKFENRLLKENKEIISILLKDNTTHKNIIWGTNNYLNFGITPYEEIKASQLVGKKAIRNKISF